MTQAELLRYVAGTFEDLGVTYMIGGPQASVYYGESALKIDVFVNKNTDYDRLRLDRRQRLPLVPGSEAYFARPEDIILYKMLYFREGQSDAHVQDILGILRVSGPEIDTAYIAEWAARLGLVGIWDSILERVQTNE